MIQTFKSTLILGALGVLSGCVAVMPPFETFNGSVTTGGNGMTFEETPMTSIPQKREVYIVTHVRWDPNIEFGGDHAVIWQWYADGKLVAVRSRHIVFRNSPCRFWCEIPASNFAPGHYRVVVAIDGKIVDTHEFDITR